MGPHTPDCLQIVWRANVPPPHEASCDCSFALDRRARVDRNRRDRVAAVVQSGQSTLTLSEVQSDVDRLDVCRQAGQYAVADAIRDRLRNMGVVVESGPLHSRFHMVSRHRVVDYHGWEF